MYEPWLKKPPMPHGEASVVNMISTPRFRCDSKENLLVNTPGEEPKNTKNQYSAGLIILVHMQLGGASPGSA